LSQTQLSHVFPFYKIFAETGLGVFYPPPRRCRDNG